MPFKEISGLREPFKSAARYLLWIIKKEELPFIVFETLRDEATQESYFKRGVTKARFGESPHNYGYAMDVVLDVKKIKTRKREWKGRNFPDAWDDETPDCVEAWFLLGGYVEDLQLTWGGTWMSKVPKIRTLSDGTKIRLGWDLPHIELTGWRSELKDSAN
tara:strand:- start:27130 stop:27612 length:483 start_codon:yes stop_codon:yes gene_type:complete